MPMVKVNVCCPLLSLPGRVVPDAVADVVDGDGGISFNSLHAAERLLDVLPSVEEKVVERVSRLADGDEAGQWSVLALGIVHYGGLTLDGGHHVHVGHDPVPGDAFYHYTFIIKYNMIYNYIILLLSLDMEKSQCAGQVNHHVVLHQKVAVVIRKVVQDRGLVREGDDHVPNQFLERKRGSILEKLKV